MALERAQPARGGLPRRQEATQVRNPTAAAAAATLVGHLGLVQEVEPGGPEPLLGARLRPGLVVGLDAELDELRAVGCSNPATVSP